MAITSISRDWGVSPSIVRITTTDNLATITAANYLVTQAAIINALNFGSFEWVIQDLVAIAYSGGENLFTYDATNHTFALDITPPGALALTNSHIFVGNASNMAADVAMSGIVAIANSGVTTIPLASANILVGSAGNLAAPVAVTGDVTLSNAGVASIAPSIVKYVQVAVTAAEFNGAYAAPKLLIAAPAAGLRININQAVFRMVFVAAQYAAGGAVALQYDSTVHGAGTLASATIAAATINGYAASSNIGVAGALASSAITTTEAKGIYLSNQTGAFTTGDGTWHIDIWYSIVTA